MRHLVSGQGQVVCLMYECQDLDLDMSSRPFSQANPEAWDPNY